MIYLLCLLSLHEDQSFFCGRFSPLGDQKNNPVWLIKRIFVEKMYQKSPDFGEKKKVLKSSYLENRFKKVAKI
jgi:hypothetical protein